MKPLDYIKAIAPHHRAYLLLFVLLGGCALVEFIRVEEATRQAAFASVQTMQSVKAQVDRMGVSLSKVIDAVPAMISDAGDRIVEKANDQVTGLRQDVRGIAKLADARTGEALELARNEAASLDKKTDRALSLADAQLTTANATLATTAWPVGELARRYTLIPDQLAADRETKGLIAETMGVLGATKVTMGQAAKTAKVIADEAPKMTGHVEQIATDATREADEITAPKTWWQKTYMIMLAVARILGAL